MICQDLEVRFFRNYAHAKINLHPRVNVFVGPNGQGKTNLIESLSVLCRGRALRSGNSEMLRHIHEGKVAETATVRGNIQKNGLVTRLEVIISAPNKRIRLINGKKSSGHQIADFPVVAFSPDSLLAIKLGPDLRRDLLDDFLITQSAEGAKLIQDYARALRARNRLLKDNKKGLYSRSGFEGVLKSFDEIFWPLASNLSSARLEALRALNPFLKEALSAMNAQRNVDISVDYLISDTSAITWSKSDLFDALRVRASELRTNEVEAAMTLVGPHRHDIRFMFGGMDSRHYCSQGQQRALVLSFLVAQIIYHDRLRGIRPFLLLDDVLSELDQEKRNGLISFLQKLESQIFLTSTDLAFSRGLLGGDMAVFNVQSGHVSPG